MFEEENFGGFGSSSLDWRFIKIVITFVVIASLLIFWYLWQDKSHFNNDSVVPKITAISSYDNSAK